MDPTPAVRIYTDEERRQIKKRVNRIALVAAASPDPGQKRYETCAAEVDRQTPKAMWHHSDDVPAAVNDAVDRLRLSVIGRCMERLEQSGY